MCPVTVFVLPVKTVQSQKRQSQSYTSKSVDMLFYMNRLSKWLLNEPVFCTNLMNELFVDLLSNMNQELLKNSFKVRTYQWIRNVAHSIYFLTMRTVNESDNES